jgi:biopolymer transport protein ExbB
MRPPIRRQQKYAAKTSGDVARARAIADGDRQKAAFRVVAGDQVGIERLTKSVLTSHGVMPALNHFYMNFAKKVARDKSMYSGATLATEVCAEYEHWRLRGLADTVLNDILSRLGLTPCLACTWGYKRKLTFSGNVSATDLDDFPVLVHLTNANFDFNKAQSLGQDIRFMDSDTCPSDGTPLDHEIEHWDKSGANAWVWVKVPRIDGGSANDFIYMFYGNGTAADGQNAAGVWSNGYVAVLHLRGNGSTNLPDSLAAYNFTKFGIGQPSNIVGEIDGAQYFDGVADHATNATLLDTMPSALVISLWIKPTSGWSSAMPTAQYFTQKRNAADNIYGLLFAAADGSMRVENRRAGATVTLISVKKTWLPQFYHISAHIGTGGMKLYVDGVLDNSHATTQVMLDGTWHDYFVGCADGPNLLCDCSIDEYRVSDSARSTDWVHAQWKSQNETLISYGPEQGT